MNEDSPLLRRTHEAATNNHFESLVIEQGDKLETSPVGERLPYNDYTTIDWLHDLAKDSRHLRAVRDRKGLRFTFVNLLDEASGWIAAAVIGLLTACVAILVDIATAIVTDWKFGYCTTNVLSTIQKCCADADPMVPDGENPTSCPAFHEWTSIYASSFATYTAIAILFGTISAGVTMLTKRSLPAASPGTGDRDQYGRPSPPITKGKTMYMACGSGIPEIKTILSGFVIPHFLDFQVLLVKAIGAVFAVSSGMCLGKEGPFVHISTCVGWLVAKRFPKFRDNGRKMREMLSVACSAGLAVAFGAPIGGVLFSYEEISTYFPHKVLWRAFLCSLSASMLLKGLNPDGTGKLVLFEAHYGTAYSAVHYLIFMLLGVAGGVFGGMFCRLNFTWSKWFRSFTLIKAYPFVEVALVAFATAVLQYHNPLTRTSADQSIKDLLVNCDKPESAHTWICQNERNPQLNWPYLGYLLSGTLTYLILTTITFGIKVPSGVIIPTLAAGALFGRLIGQCIPGLSPGCFAMVGAAAFLAGVSRMTISLCVVMIELTGELEYALPHMVAILIAKWTAETIGKDGVYDLAQTVLGHPFLDAEHAMGLVQRRNLPSNVLVPPRRTLEEITVVVPGSNKVSRGILETKLAQLRGRGMLDAGLALTYENGMVQGYLGQEELSFGLASLIKTETEVRLLGDSVFDSGECLDLSRFVDRTPLTICGSAPLEYVVEMFAKLGLRHIMLVEEGTGRFAGVIIKKRLLAYLDHLKRE